MNNNVKVKFNFDCYQLISFRFSDVSGKQLNGLDLFEKIGFNVLIDHDIKEVEKEYFEHILMSFLLNLKTRSSLVIKVGR